MSRSSNTGHVLRVGIFFDGTANNQYNSQLGLERQAQGLKVDPGSSYAGAPTNIARLHQHYPVQTTFSDGQAVTSLYISGIGTTTGAADSPFPGLSYGTWPYRGAGQGRRGQRAAEPELGAFYAFAGAQHPEPLAT